jgi:glycosyltransferase involved in cell wall biosynthesis
MAKISVIIATYNRRELVEQAVRSVLEQSQPVHEIIVVDDGSSDGTAEHLCQTFPGIVILRQANSGESVARNRGIAAASGEWIAFLDDDDLWHRDKVRHTVRYLEAHPDCQAVATTAWYFSQKPGGPKTGYNLKRDFVAGDLEECHRRAEEAGRPANDFGYLDIRGHSFQSQMERHRGSVSSSVIKRELVILAGCFPPAQDRGEDWTFCTNVARFAEWHLLDVPLLFQRLHENQQTKNAVGGLFILGGYVNAWYTGRPTTRKMRNLEMLAELAAYGPKYRRMVQGMFWDAIFSGQFRLSGRVYHMGRLLLPRTRDWLYVLTPPQITYRMRRLFRRAAKAPVALEPDAAVLAPNHS